MRSLLFTEKVDFLIGNTYGKYLERDCGTPLIRLGFPIFDRHHYHRFPIWGYQGALRVLVMLLDEYFEQLLMPTPSASQRPTTATTSFANASCRRPQGRRHRRGRRARRPRRCRIQRQQIKTGES
jgi:hypothetical protein